MICGILPYRHAPQRWTGCSRQAGTRTAVVRNNVFEVIKGSFSPVRDAKFSVFTRRSYVLGFGSPVQAATPSSFATAASRS